MSRLHRLGTARTSDELEARDTSIDPLMFAIDPIEADGDHFWVGDDVILHSSDGDTFTGHLSDVEDDRLRIYVELD